MNPVNVTPPPFTSPGRQPDKVEKRESLLETANRLINRERAKDYGDVRTSFNQISDLWSVYLNRHIKTAYPDLEVPIQLSNEDVANLMILMKVSRAQNGFHLDSYIDIAGYAGCVELLQEN